MARQPLTADTILGTGNDQYRIEHVLGPGGFGITYLARSLRLDRDVAVKEYFPAEFAYRDGSSTIRSSAHGSSDFFAQGKRYFIEEARTLGKFQHEHIVRVIGLLEENNTAYMVLEFEEGPSFKNWLRGLGRRPTQDELDSIFEPILSALESIHDKSIFHRDIAPDNIIIRPNGRPVLIDFGAARQFARDNSHTLGAIVKHGYSPPEQYTLDTKLQGSWSDIYALCATMYYAILGSPPEEASKRQLHDTVLPVEEHMDPFVRDDYHPSFLAGINAGLELRPKDRPGTISELREVLHEGRDELKSVTTPTRPRQRAPDPALLARPSTGGLGPISGRDGTVVQARGRTGQPTGGNRSQNSRPQPADTWPQSANRRPTAPQQAVAFDVAAAPAPSPVSERSLLAAGYVAVGVAAISAFGFLLIGGLGHPAGMVPLIAICLGLCLAALERGISQGLRANDDIAATAASTAVVSALVLAIYWLPHFLFPVSFALAGLAGAFAWLRYGNWVPVTLMVVAGLHFAFSLWMLLLARVEVIASESYSGNAMFWPLMAACLAVISLLVLFAAVQMRRRTGAEALL